MNKTSIEYLDYSWNPIATRCTPISSGCQNCWHLAMAKRLAENRGLNGLTLSQREAYKGGLPYLIERELSAPLRLKKPARIGVQFMGDLFHKDVPWGSQIKIFETMANASRHTYFILTKRPEGMRQFLQGCEDWDPSEWPHVWLGVSCEDQQTADERIPILLQIPAAHRWVSIEPILGPMDLRRIVKQKEVPPDPELYINAMTKWDKIDWVVLGGESGPHARPMKLEWARSLVNQCHASSVPVFVKQLTIDGKISKKMEEWPEYLRIREIPDVRQ